ncbi:LysR family transcriptional regulator [Streptomyces oceani]|uniref:LysR family transcriptional regulator n=1 Tax=Streptomyces oceani TaxID=1075402 RepID=UPI0009A123CF|nr:LysR family transcriptional regulator [Streptomyces oceani]
MPRDLDPRLLRAFAAVADELHFTRAAARLYVAQQALSRDIRRLEREVGGALFVRTTRQVTLTPEGERLLPYARAVLAAQDQLTAAVASGTKPPLRVDVAAPVSTGQRVLDAARERASRDTEFVARYLGGLARGAAEILAGRLDASFGRAAGLAPGVLDGLEHRLVRYERVAVLLPVDHPLAGLAEVPLARLAGETLYAGAGNPDTTEWTDYARTLLTGHGVQLAAPYPKLEGDQEFIRAVRKHRWLVLGSTVFTEIPGMVLRPLVEPAALAPVSLVWRRGLSHHGLDALVAAAERLGAEGDWLARPANSWLPDADERLLGAEERPG